MKSLPSTKMTGDLGLPGFLPFPQSGMRSGVTTHLGVPGCGSRNPSENSQGVAGDPGGPGPALWMPWMISTGPAPPNPEDLLPRVMGGEAGPTHLPEVAAGTTSMTPTTLGTRHIPEIPTITMTRGPGTAVLTPDPIRGPGILGMPAPGLGTLITTGDC